MKELKAWSDLIGKWVTIAGAFAGGIFAVVQYLEKQEAERVKAALEYVQQLDKDQLYKARMSIREYWNPKAELVFQKAKAGEKELYKFIDSSFRQARLEGQLANVVGFYENVRVCTCGKICDERVVRRFMGKEANDLFMLSYPYIAEQRKLLRDESFATGLERLARNHTNEARFIAAYCPRGSL